MNPDGCDPRTRAIERRRAAPAVDHRRHPGSDPDGVGRQEVGDDLQVRRGRHFDERLPLRDEPSRSRGGA